MLRNILVTLFALLTLSCLDTAENPAYDPVGRDQKGVQEQQESEQPYTRDEAWVCHHPGTHMHDTECIEAEYPDGCYVNGNKSIFCWLLMRPECEDPKSREAVQSVCHLLRQ